MFFMKFKEEASMRSGVHELELMRGWNYSPRLSSVRGADDPFHQEQEPFSVDSGCNTQDHDHEPRIMNKFDNRNFV